MWIKEFTYLITIFFLNVSAMYLAMITSPSEQTLGESIRIFYIHVPSAWLSYLSFGVSFALTILFLYKKNFKFDFLAEDSAIIGLFYGVVAILTGSIWAKATWGLYWHWDPRETATLILELAYVGYIVLRRSIVSIEKKAFVSGIYNVLSFLSLIHI